MEDYPPSKQVSKFRRAGRRRMLLMLPGGWMRGMRGTILPSFHFKKFVMTLKIFCNFNGIRIRIKTYPDQHH